MEGVSSMHGGHQVAQKFSTSSLPPKPGVETRRPLSAVMVNGGACSPATTTWMGRSYTAEPTTATNATSNTASAPRMTQSMVLTLCMGENYNLIVSPAQLLASKK